ncbi:hypothetical protein H310_05106 [Aphanomyces invadans]|uniref:Elongator complex protein 2 n=1 Tax=Aphanomyces invadans TaxID=157072 RepID=A0A024UCW2_9STRA|nr:hypothetical protein H310_05106 [Aphanomyces invadans]ETW03727.1 hypothetical protein H310_05106 [Aphanomyces invadans]|eukprot:XP_008867956.1 hypothetical protein H310_05106 [Aphanomyces invadans]
MSNSLMAMEVAFAAVGCNNASQCMSRAIPTRSGGSAYRIAYGASSSIAIALFTPSTPPSTPTIVNRLHGHRARISSVYWGSQNVNSGEDRSIILSGDAAGTVRVHTELSDNLWVSQDVATCSGSISAVNSISTPIHTFLLAATSIGDVFVYTLQSNGATTPCSTLTLGERHIVETIATIGTSDGCILLALGGVDLQVHLYKLDHTASSTDLVHIASLSGHKGWIRGLDFTASGEQSVLLASASQDHKIRLWRITPASMEVSFDAMLVGHDDWVTSVLWVAPGRLLLSSSMDNRLILWHMGRDNHQWTPQLRVGDLGGSGLLACAAPPSSLSARVVSEVVALTFGGQLHRWATSNAGQVHFAPIAGVTGHTRAVADVVWSLCGDYFVTLSRDQTARAFAKAGGSTWTEISRVQVHGYDLTCGCFVDPSRFVSGADEKILRVFAVPEGMAALVRGEPSSAGFGMVPELSLTTKPTTPLHDPMPTDRFVGEQLNRSVWPELQKLYGHGHELLCVTTNAARTTLASACKSRDEKFAAVWLWDSSKSDIVALQQLPGHASSVVQLAFSPNDQNLISVSKDRHVCVFTLQSDGSYALASKQKVHKRIVWTCGWSHDSRFFATGSRDETMLVWGQLNSTWQPMSAAMSFPSAVTALAFGTTNRGASGSYVIAVGLESGCIHLVTATISDEGQWAFDMTLAGFHAHAGTVTKLAWHPTTAGLLVSSSEDASVVLLQVDGLGASLS